MAIILPIDSMKCLLNFKLRYLTLKKELETFQIRLKSLYSQPLQFHIQ